MKRILPGLFLFAAVLTGLQVSATVRTVSNNPNRPAQFTTIQAAVTASSPNDTILITGGTYQESVSIVLPLVFYGEALATTPGFPETLLYGTSFNFGRLNSSLSSNGSRMYGFRLSSSSVTVNGSFGGALPGQTTMTDFMFERCDFDYGCALNLYANDGLSSVTVRNCRFNTYSSIGFHGPSAFCGGGCFSDIIVTNCMFAGYQQYHIYGSNYDFNGGVLLRNNVFIYNITSVFYAVIDMVIENNIFFKAEPTGASGCTFNNNLTYLCNSNDLPYGDNFGSGNIENANPLFNNYPALGGAHDYAHNYGLQSGSPGLGTGTNGSDMGINGGNAPVTNIPIWAKIPGVTLLNIPVSSVPVGGTLQIQIEAVSRD